uniref:GPS domain-containing protein n=1 Tax=Anopheles dirus TaxID=7168 RepID=A0A182N5H4_9DIPT
MCDGIGYRKSILQVRDDEVDLCKTGLLGAEKPTFRIIAPEFICNPETTEKAGFVGNGTRGNSTQSPSRELTIGFQTSGGQQLHYRVRAYFTLLGDIEVISQRHTVGLWRAVRQLEQRVRRDRDVIAQRGQMTIGTDELLPGVMYSFGVVAVDAAGTESDEQNFTMTYRTADQGASYEHGGTSRSGNDVSLLMLGAEVCYADREYIVTAQLIFCRRRTDYYFRWSIAGGEGGAVDESELVAVEMERSKTLKVPAGRLLPGRAYDIEVSVLSSKAVDEIIAKARMRVSVLQRQPEVVLFPVDAIVGIDRPVQIRSYASDGEVTWSCVKKDGGDGGNCDDTMDISDGSTIVTFYKVGQHLIKASIGHEMNSANYQSTLTVHSKVTPSVRLLQWSRYPAVAGEAFELLVTVAGLVPNCHSHWNVLQEDGLAYFDQALLPGTGTLGGLLIRDIEENFLSELVDYGNDTVVKDVTLSIPASQGSWKGLEPDVRYKLRLETVCPEPIDDSRKPDQQAQRDLVTSHWTFVLETNGAPRALPVELSPAGTGTALETVFKISTGIAQDSERDYPLTYAFWYTADGVHINVGTYGEITSAETVLPYTKTGTVGTYVIVCDARSACTKISGPDVRILPGKEQTVQGIALAFESIEGFFDRLNYRDALKTAFELLTTVRNSHSSLYDRSYSRFVELLKQAIVHIGKVYRETTFLSEASIEKFITQTKPILDLEESSNHELFQQLLELMEQPSGDGEQPIARSKRSPQSSASLPSAGAQGTSKINTKLTLMESLTVSKNASIARQSRASLLSYVHQATKSYCALESHFVFVGQLLTLEMNRYRSLSEVNFTRMAIPNNVTVETPTGRVRFADVFRETKYFCLGRVYYARDLFAEKAAHELDLGFYEAFVLSVEQGGMWTLVDWKSDYFLWSLDGRRLPNVTCQLWEDGAWSSRHCTTVETATDTVLCNCTTIAYLRISNETEAELVEESVAGTSPAATTVISTSVTEPSPESTTVAEPESTVDAASIPSKLVTSTMGSAVIISDVVTATESDMLTLASITASSSSLAPAENVSIPTPFNTSVKDNGTPSALLQSSNGTGSGAPLHNRSHKPASIGYTIVGALAITSLALVVLVVVYRRRKTVLRLADELHTVPSRARTQSSPHVRYARFQDEHNMSGDNVSTISDVLTI